MKAYTYRSMVGQDWGDGVAAVEVLAFDGNDTCLVRHNSDVVEVKSRHLYDNEGSVGSRWHICTDSLPHPPRHAPAWKIEFSMDVEYLPEHATGGDEVFYSTISSLDGDAVARIVRSRPFGEYT